MVIKMKKLLTMLLLICLCMSITACGRKQEKNERTSSKEVKLEKETVSEESETETENTSKKQEKNSTEQKSTTKDSTEETDESSTLVVYFSNTGNTKAIAEKIAGGLAADIYEIVPENPYTDADLDYSDDNSRSTIEMNDPTVRPAIKGSINNFKQYDTIYIGYPIWWGEAPRILDTFVESYDFTNMTIIPFCTSDVSGIGSSAKTLEKLAGSGSWMNGQRFSGSESENEVMKWVNIK